MQHPQTNGKIERFFQTVEEKLPRFKSLDDLIEWYNMRTPHMSLNLDVIETPYKVLFEKDAARRNSSGREIWRNIRCQEAKRAKGILIPGNYTIKQRRQWINITYETYRTP